jgi:hypothetical protein
MKETTNNSTQLFTPPFGGRGAKKYISPRIEWIPLDNEISLALESSPPVGPSETFNSVQPPFKEESGLV